MGLNKIVIVGIKFFLLLLMMVVIESCAVSNKLTHDINKLYGHQNLTSYSKKSSFIKSNRKQLIKILTDKNPQGKYFIIENYHILFTPFTVFAVIKDSSGINFYSSEPNYKKIQVYVDDQHQNYSAEIFYEKVLTLASENKFERIQNLHLENNRQMSESGVVFLTIVNFKNRRKYDIIKTIKFEEFGLTQDDYINLPKRYNKKTDSNFLLHLSN